MFLLIFGVLITVYLGLCGLIGLWQTKFIFFPSPIINATPVDFDLTYEEVWLNVSTGKIHGWWLPSSQANAPVLLYFHGNGSNNGDSIARVPFLHQLGFSVFLFDYRGYGLSNGPFPNEKMVYEDSEAAWRYLTQTRQIAPRQIFLLGHSLGGAIAIDLASKYPDIAGAIIECSFTSMLAMSEYVGRYKIIPVDWLLTQRFDSLAKVKNLDVPLLFIHGRDDGVVPYQMSEELYTAANEPKQLLLISEANHNDVAAVGGEKYVRAIEQFVEQVLETTEG